MELKKIYHPEIPAEQISESNSWKPSYGAITSRLWPRICTSKKDLWKTVSWRCRKVWLWVSTAGLATNWHLCAGGPCPVDIQLKSSRGVVVPCAKRRPFLWLRDGITASVEWLPGLEDGKKQLLLGFFCTAERGRNLPCGLWWLFPQTYAFCQLGDRTSGFQWSRCQSTQPRNGAEGIILSLRP